MTLNYEVEVYYDPIDDYSETESFEYEPSFEDVKNAILEIICNKYFKKTVIDKQTFKKNLQNFIEDLGIDFDDAFEEDLKNYFYKDAMESRS